MKLSLRQTAAALLYIMAGFLAATGALCLLEYGEMTYTAIFYLYTMICIGLGALVQTGGKS